jgi:16S rRNA (guanine966-N2)-methyltransferase
MGEEKPDEELMGKRKPSPRLSTTWLMSIIQGLPSCGKIYNGVQSFCDFSVEYVTIALKIEHAGDFKVRVISGTAKGRPLKAVPGTGTRPTTDKVKEAVFSMIGPYFGGGQGLDLFAGTGGLGIEALSRGLDHAIFIDLDKASIQVIHDNLKATGFTGQAEVYRNDAVRALKPLAKRELRFDLIFLDPPYRMKHVDAILLQLEQLKLVHNKATVLVEHDALHHYADIIGSFHVRKRALYGETAITIYHFQQDEL